MRAASDVGGTFTDLVYYRVDPQTGDTGSVQVVKTDTTPPDFERGVVNSLTKGGLSPESLSFFAHGSTVVINALTERKGAKTGLITTAGFRDVLEIGRGNRPDLFNLNFRKPAPFVDRYLRRELTERVNYKGGIETPVELDPLPDILESFRSGGVEAIALVFLHAYANPANEKAALARIKALWPDVSVLASHEISREWREYERTSTTVLSAFVHPVADRYIQRLEDRLAAGGCNHPPYMMQSNGGIATVAATKANPITMVESGPAGGVFAAAQVGRLIDERDLIVLDIGGTTAKCTLIEDGEIKIVSNYAIERTRKTPGYPIRTPVVEIVEIGNGGGSIAWLDEGKKLHVGPKSAGAEPGPAAYGRGGRSATTTDANLVLGRIDPESFAGGAIDPDWDAVAEAFAPLEAGLDCSRQDVARGIIRIANANMVNALRLVSVNKGHDPRDFALMAFGGGGAMHAADLARELKIPKVIVPANSAVFSAWGILQCDLRRDYLQTDAMVFGEETASTLQAALDHMQGRAIRDFKADGIPDAAQSVQMEALARLRYRGQEHTVETALVLKDAGRIDVAGSTAAFHERYEQRYGYRLDAPLEVVTLHLVAKIAIEKPALPTRTPRPSDPLPVTAHRRVDFDRDGIHDAAIVDGCAMAPGMVAPGPAVIQEPSATFVVPPGSRAEVDAYGNYILTFDEGGGA